jgi:hypothetical protein
MNGVLDAGQPVLDNLDKIMTCADSWMAYNAALGQWSIVINKSETAVYAFDDDNIIGEVRVSATDITQSINQVEAKFPDKGARDQPNFVNIATPDVLRYPNEPDNKYSVTYDLCNDSVQAQYLANRILEQAREDLIVSFSTTYYGIQVDAGAVVSVTNADYGWSNKLFRVVKVNEASLPDGSLGARLEMNEYSAAVYDDFDITQYVPVPNSDIPSAIYFSALSTPTVLSSSPSTTPATFTVRVSVPVTGRVTFGTLYYTTSVSPADYDWKVLQTASTPLGTSATNGANYDFVNLQLSAGTYYFTYVVGNELGSSARSPTSTAFNWSPVNSESGNVSALQSQVTLLSIDVADKVSKTTANILTGTIVPQDLGGIKVGSIAWNTSGIVTSGSGIAITENGIVGAKSGVPNFTIDTAGNALFKGDINTAGDAYFAGDNQASVTVPFGTSSFDVDYSSWADGQTNAISGSVLRVGSFGSSTATTSAVNIGVLGYAPDTGKGYGVIGIGGYGGGFFQGTGNSSSAITAVAFNTTTNAIDIVGGKFKYQTVTIEPPPAISTSYLRGNGQWGAVPFNDLNLTGVNLVAQLIGTTGQTSGLTGVIFSGTLTGGASGTLTWTMGSSTAALNINVTSDERLKKDIQDIEHGIDFIKKLRPVQFKWNHELFTHYGEKQAFGFLAGDVEKLVGEDTTMVTTIEQGPLEGYKSFSNDGIVAALVKAVQDLSVKIDEQQKLIESLQNKG